ncbi:hypothetical protein DOY81_007915 [Sarcophaga bullata]|nr:hypothetical protein DOY81_007915 [Sarcophaga bullata]
MLYISISLRNKIIFEITMNAEMKYVNRKIIIYEKKPKEIVCKKQVDIDDAITAGIYSDGS